ncbi:MAG: 2-hydroxyhepta-2,4-diene-1,7-dioate isomerase [Marinosulfonomonas sp.]|nr:MAG: 2-hydroxyhepta-2,4-diene-1,7-dioate isomerase [Marinosulfonomonas sp.]
MKFVRYGDSGAEKPGVLDDAGNLRDLSGVIDDLSGAALGRLGDVVAETLPLVAGNVRFGPPVSNVGKLVCIGLNYYGHAAEMGMDIPTEPVVFLKATSAISGPNDPIAMPRGSEKTDWEAELGIVIGTAAKYVNQTDALSHVAGYLVVNEVSERALQLEHGGQWTKGKSCDTFAPLGPWLVTPDEVGDVQNLAVTLSVNGAVMQAGNTSDMIFPVAKVISYLSQIMTLHPGDIISTGTPAGVGVGMKPQRFLRAGDVVELAIEKLGGQRQVVHAD